MPEPDQLDDFMTGLPPAHPLPAAEVRRRGDRLRRRRTALGAVAGVAVVALAIGIPVATLGGHHSDQTPVAPSPTTGPTEVSKSPSTTVSTPTSWRQQVPAGFPLAQGLPTPHTDPAPALSVGEHPATAGLVPVCGSQAWALGGVVDTLTANHQGDSEDQAFRTLALYPDDAAAAGALAALEAAVAGCPTTPLGGGTQLQLNPVAVDLGTDDSYSFAQQVRDNSSRGQAGYSQLTLVQVAREGNALLFDSNYTSAGGNGVLTSQTQRLKDRSQPVRTAMCTFAGPPDCPA